MPDLPVIINRTADPLVHTRAEAAALLTISLRMLSALIAKKAIRIVKIGDRTVIRREDLKAFLETRVR